MKRIPTVSVAMTPFPYAVDTDLPVVEARKVMQAHDIRHLPVTKSGDVVGIVTDKVLRGAGASAPVGALCRTPFLVDINSRLDVVVLQMADQHRDHAVVIRQGKMVGIVTASDVCRVLAQILRDQFGPIGGGGDDDVA